MTRPMPDAKEMIQAFLKFHEGMNLLGRQLSSRDPAVTQKSSEVLQQVGLYAVPFLTCTLNGSNNRDLCFRVISILDAIGPQAWEKAFVPLYPKIHDNKDPEVCARLIQAFKCLKPYKPPVPATEGLRPAVEEPPQGGDRPEGTNGSSINLESSEIDRTPPSARVSRRGAKSTRKIRYALVNAMIPPED